jgi:Uma2 family endonuclease
MATTTATKTWTYSDLFTLPDDGKRYEIIDGELFKIPSPSLDHATAVMNLILLLAPIVDKLGGRIFTAPVDVFVAGGDPVQPDIMVLLPERRGLMTTRGIEGPPSLLIEVVSRSNIAHDRVTKRRLYAIGGVPECWLGDPESRTIEIIALDGDTYRTLIRAKGNEVVRSSVLPDLSFSVSAAFAASLPR